MALSHAEDGRRVTGDSTFDRYVARPARKKHLADFRVLEEVQQVRRVPP